MAISKIENSSLASGVPGTANLPAGTVLQVVNATYSTQTATTSSTWADSGLSATITPSSPTSKILCLVNIQGCLKSASSSNAYLAIRLLRGASVITNIEYEQGYNGTTQSNSTGGSGVTYLDSPSTTSATTYKVQISNAGNSGSVSICGTSVSSTITLMEIAA